MKSPRKASIVVGLGFGDEGKGLMTDYLAAQNPSETLVLRFNGGHQAGHTVVLSNGIRHVFSNLGAGTLRGVPSYWSAFCTVYPAGLLHEWDALRQLGITPRLMWDAHCPITTHYDQLANRTAEMARGANRHGSCGLGFGATIARHTLTPYKLHAHDLAYPDIALHKLHRIRQYYATQLPNFEDFDHDAEDRAFEQYLHRLQALLAQQHISIHTATQILGDKQYTHLVFEGAQGVLLDMDFGFFPHVTRSHTTSRNALALLQMCASELLPHTSVYGISRCYQTRHGAGEMAHEAPALPIIINPHETNQFNDYQGAFRLGYLQTDWLRYALQCDQYHSAGLARHLVFTCLDQLPNEGRIPYFVGQEQHHSNLHALLKHLGTPPMQVWVSRGATAETIAAWE